MDKAPDAFLTTSEVAGDLNVPQHEARFWETAGSPDQADEAEKRAAANSRTSAACFTAGITHHPRGAADPRMQAAFDARPQFLASLAPLPKIRFDRPASVATEYVDARGESSASKPTIA